MKEKETIEYLDLKSLFLFKITRSSCGRIRKGTASTEYQNAGRHRAADRPSSLGK